MGMKEQVDLRSELTRCLRRFLVGPLNVHDTHWTSSSPPPTVVDANFSAVEARPIGPWVGVDGEEILDTPPYRIYSLGVLYPLGMQFSSQFDEFENDEPTPADDPKIADAAPDALDDDESVNESIDTGRSTLSFTVRLPRGVKRIEVSLEFGTYHPIHVAGIAQTWWHRRSHKLATTLDLFGEGNSDHLIVNDNRIEVGVNARPDLNGDVLATLWIRNESSCSDENSNVTATLYQTRMSAKFETLLPYQRDFRSSIDEVDLLYRDVENYAIGHGIDVEIEHVDGCVVVTSVPMPEVKVPALTPDITNSRGTHYGISMSGLADEDAESVAAVDLLIDDYREWIDRLEPRLASINERFAQLARENVDACQRFLADVVDGWSLVLEDRKVGDVFRDMCRAMSMQRRAYAAETRKLAVNEAGTGLVVSAPNPHVVGTGGGTWRPFQIAFILANLRKVVDGEQRRSDIDLIWMPTGGGKTEAYLGLAGFVILWTRRCDPNGVGAKPSTKVLMRYTYRLLTVQQLVRAAALICALERIREASPEKYGNSEVRIGCWLGNKTTPKDAETAVAEVAKWAREGKEFERGAFILTRCPWCGCEMGLKHASRVLGYRQSIANGKKRVLLHCPADDCEFGFRNVGAGAQKRERGIPLLYCDSELYDYPPDFVVGTIDKVATMAWKPESGKLFGIKNGSRFAPPPSLFIQDELHLITGSLGSLDAMYEAALEFLCSHDGGRPPMIVASSATTRNYREQISALYGRKSRIVPPLGLEIADSFFAVKDDALPGKSYVAISASGFVSAANLQTKVAAVLAHFVPVVEDSEWQLDPYWTNVLFFSSRRSLARMLTTVEDSLYKLMRAVRSVTGLSSGLPEGDSRKPTRLAKRRIQITATSSDDVNTALEQLGVQHPDADAVDLCFATSMVEVGLDVPRLGLMTVMGQPKSASQYIQVTGRVGRGSNSPALVPVVLSHTNVRDLSHFETFRMFHERLYASVEPASVTPFTYQSMTRTVRGCVALLSRITDGAKSLPRNSQVVATSFRGFLRANRVLSKDEDATIARVFNEIVTELSGPAIAAMDWESNGPSGLILGYGEAEPVGRGTPYWRVMSSMRSVDSEAVGRILGEASETRATVDANTPSGEEGDDL